MVKGILNIVPLIIGNDNNYKPFFISNLHTDYYRVNDVFEDMKLNKKMLFLESKKI